MVNNTTSEDARLDGKIDAFFEKFRKRDDEKRQERLDFMATQPQSKPCNVHPDCIRPIDEAVTEEITNYLSNSHGYPVAGYAPCPKCAQEIENQQLKKLGVPDNMIHARFCNFIPKDQIQAGHVEVVREFCQKRIGFLILTGKYGLGKTHLSIAALRKFEAGWLVKQGTLLRLLRATYGDDRADDPIERAKRASLLVLDDAGQSAGGKDELPMLHEILDHRHGQRLPTIITSNLSFDDLCNVLGERMADRLRECTFRVLVFIGKSHRRDARERYFDAPPVKPPQPGDMLIPNGGKSVTFAKMTPRLK